MLTPTGICTIAREYVHQAPKQNYDVTKMIMLEGESYLDRLVLFEATWEKFYFLCRRM